MKRLLTYSIIIAITFLGACRKSDNPNIPDLTRVPVPLITVDEEADITISKDDPALFKGKFVVDNYFKEGSKPKKLDILIIKNGDNSSAVHFKDDITTFPTTLDITGVQLIALFGPMIQGDEFTIGANVTTEKGEMFEGFPNAQDSRGKYVNPYGGGLNGLPGASTQISYSVVCPLIIDDFVGEATVVDPYFFEGEYKVTISKAEPGVLKVTGINEEPNVAILINLDGKRYTASVAGQIVSDRYGPYHNLTMTGKGSIDACKNSLKLTINWTVDEGSFGDGDFIIKK